MARALTSAPGTEIKSALHTSTTGLTVKQGTGWLALVAGVAALILQREPTAKPEQVFKLLLKTAKKVRSPGWWARRQLAGAVAAC